MRGRDKEDFYNSFTIHALRIVLLKVMRKEGKGKNEEGRMEVDHLALLGGDGGVPGNESCEHSSESLYPQRERSHVQQEHVRHVARQDPTLDGRPYRYCLVRVDRMTGYPAKDPPHRLLHLCTHTQESSHTPPHEMKGIL